MLWGESVIESQCDIQLERINIIEISQSVYRLLLGHHLYKCYFLIFSQMTLFSKVFTLTDIKLNKLNPSLVGGGRKVVTPHFQSLIAPKWNIWWFPTCCTLGHIYTLCILGPQKISKFSLYLSYSLVMKWAKYSYQDRVKSDNWINW